MCKIKCDKREGLTLDPHNGCDCIPMDYAKKIYPEWANEKDMFYAIELGRQDIIMSKEPKEVDPRDEREEKDEHHVRDYDRDERKPEDNERPPRPEPRP